ncbi:hypothetical protein [Halobellus ruber]|uniref:Uncharacterized protein n=1 Tax=Halobellus ruber TaxID=2761102 RepID=A0A7J9SHU8_9EURY|nr:hypothetical protein [Halobellus ruber]MBB6646062.1 hypothetical protein [Halobellus ruber]
MDRRQLARDGLLAAATCGALLLGAGFAGVDRRAFADPLLVGVGCVGMVGIEILLLRNPELTRRLWNRRSVRIGSALGVLVAGWLAASTGAARVVAAVAWGLVAYVGLVGVVLVAGRNPLARLA